MEAPGRFRADVEGLRALAVLAVVAYHAGLGWLGGGFVGGDVFYVVVALAAAWLRRLPAAAAATLGWVGLGAVLVNSWSMSGSTAWIRSLEVCASRPCLPRGWS